MKNLLKASIPIIIGAIMGLGIDMLLTGICFDFIYNHFGETGLYIIIFVGSVVMGTIAYYVVHKYVFDKEESEE